MNYSHAIVVGVNLDGEIAEALDPAFGITLDSRAGYIRRALVGILREAGRLPAPEAPRRHRGERRTNTGSQCDHAMPILFAIGEAAGRLGRTPTAEQIGEIGAGLRKLVVIDIMSGNATIIHGGIAVSASKFIEAEDTQPWIEHHPVLDGRPVEASA